MREISMEILVPCFYNGEPIERNKLSEANKMVGGSIGAPLVITRSFYSLCKGQFREPPLVYNFRHGLYVPGGQFMDQCVSPRRNYAVCTTVN
jgi:hypothetical protein